MSEFDNANDSMLEMYLFESTTLLEQLDDILLQSEKDENLSSENINEIFRIMHTIKGSSAMMEFDTIAHVSHKLEDLFYVIRDKGIEQDFFQDLFDLVLKVSDFLKEEVEKIRVGQRHFEENEELISEILEFLERMSGGNSAAEKKSSKTSKAKEVKDNSSEPKISLDTSVEVPANDASDEVEGMQTYYLHVYFTADCQMENIRAFMLVNKLETVGKVYNM